jgi:hypothetical protein
MSINLDSLTIDPESDFYEQTVNTNLKTLEKITNKKNYIEKLKELKLINHERYLFFFKLTYFFYTQVNDDNSNHIKEAIFNLSGLLSFYSPGFFNINIYNISTLKDLKCLAENLYRIIHYLIINDKELIFESYLEFTDLFKENFGDIVKEIQNIDKSNDPIKLAQTRKLLYDVFTHMLCNCHAHIWLN